MQPIEVMRSYLSAMRAGDREAAFEHFADDIVVTVENAPHAPRRPKILGHDPDRHTGAAVFAGRPVGDRLTAAEAAVGE